ncbi:MAG: hypothetical protein ACI4V5_03840, partial [Prevotella sp.]
MTRYLLPAILFAFCIKAAAEDYSDIEKSKAKPFDGLTYKVEMQSSVSEDKTPLWLNANKYGLSSLEKSNGYMRAALIRPLRADSARRWGIGYGLDMAVPYHYTSNIVVQQAFFEARWLNGSISVGSREYPMELKNNRLSSGSQTLGINSRPVPQVRLALPDYWTLPFLHGWLHLKGHIAYGKMTDDNWQHDFTSMKSNYANDVLYHSKAGYIKIGNDKVFCPFSVELGLEMACTFGGTAYQPDDNGEMMTIKNRTGLGAYWNAFLPGGSDATETVYLNSEGNQVGSWLIRINWDNDIWGVSLYADKYFEDHSSMFQLGSSGYGTGEEWQQKQGHKFMLYDFKDIMLGTELRFPQSQWVKCVVLEYLYTKYQSGPIYHDHTTTIADQIGGKDNFYNHSIYTGWQHWGQVIGNPLYRSPIYNTDGNIEVQNNRFMAFHLGMEGQPYDNFTWRALASWQEGLGTYDNPYDEKHHNVSFLVEGRYAFSGKLLKGWSINAAYGMDFGKILGHNHGFQL